MKLLGRAAALAAALALAGACYAQSGAPAYPTRQIRVIVPFTAGGPTDVIARLFAQKLSESLGQQAYVEDMPGAGGNLGTATAAKAPADGYTLVMVSTGFVVNPSLYAKVPYDPIKDFAPVTLVAASPNVMVINPSVPAKTVAELMALIRANPGTYSFAGPGIGSTPHLAGELFKLKNKLDLVHIPFNGAPPAVASTIGGHTQIAFTALPPSLSNIKDGKLRALAVLSPMRHPALPDVPSAVEAGVPDLESDTLTGLLAPAGTPPEIVAILQREAAKMVAQPDVKEKLDTLGFVPVANTSAEFAARIKTELARWADVVHAANIKIE
jgi:tripartite-type tricarboxylate transporter receptor subunit TctC